ncbi:hypothetical protein [Paenibacillus sp. XY044]|uniref:hypothetical protein n=1 Tax=Paenibacillus sp. XY044 TaxID=2026089 RepID=UPI000B9851AC|nr:hypothetical protein [Paenibacillus sp. XY044]OZB91232.1 hypothetical protein CJP46_28445 [Paenibacillus sp. XY044]
MIKKMLVLMLICAFWLPANLGRVQASGLSPSEETLWAKHNPLSMVRNSENSAKLPDNEANRLRDAYGLDKPETVPRQSFGDFGASFRIQEMLVWACALFLSWAWL